MVYVIEGIPAVTLGAGDTLLDVAVQTAIPVEKEASSFAALFNNVWEWIKNIF